MVIAVVERGQRVRRINCARLGEESVIVVATKVPVRVFGLERW